MARSKHTDDCGIYKWTNLVTGRVLVGQAGSTTGFTARKCTYFSQLRSGKYKTNNHFQRSFTKHGEANFSFEILERMPIGDLTIEQHKPILTAREQFWLDHYRALPGGVYNQVGTVDGPLRGSFRSSETKAKMSVSMKGKKRDARARANISAAHTGVPWSEKRRATHERKKQEAAEALAKLPVPAPKIPKKRGPVPGTHSPSEETRAKIGDANRGRPSPGKGKTRAPEIGQKISAAKTGKEQTEAQRAGAKAGAEKLRGRQWSQKRRHTHEAKQASIAAEKAAATTAVTLSEAA